MEHGDLVKVASGGPVLDGIVFDLPSRTKVVVAVVEPGRGPVFRTVHPDALSERETEGADDAAIRMLFRRTPPPSRPGGRGASASGHGRAGHQRTSMHRRSSGS